MNLKYHSLFQLVRTRMLVFFREPEAIFWTYGFPLIMVVGLGLAFRNKGPEVLHFDVVEGPAAERVKMLLKDSADFQITVSSASDARERLTKNKTPLVVSVDDAGDFVYRYDPVNPDSGIAHLKIDNALQRAAGRKDAIPTQISKVDAPGTRYVDWLVPGLIGMNIMSGGMWGLGFTLVDMRVRNLLKRLMATPMVPGYLLLAMIGVRLFFIIPELTFMLLCASFLFKVKIMGNLLTLLITALVGAVSFSGLGLLTASRASRIETIAGLLNLIMMPMWLMSGTFFSADRFPDFLQPFIQALPLTQLNNALRAIALDGAGLSAIAWPLAVLLLWGGASYALALKWFRWN